MGRAGHRPGAAQGLLLIFVELMLITAIALFFSTFSTPLLSAALTFGFYIVGHFNADLRNFERVVDSRPAAWLARACTTCCQICRRSTSRLKSSTDCRCRLGYLAITAAYGLA